MCAPNHLNCAVNRQVCSGNLSVYCPLLSRGKRHRPPLWAQRGQAKPSWKWGRVPGGHQPPGRTQDTRCPRQGGECGRFHLEPRLRGPHAQPPFHRHCRGLRSSQRAPSASQNRTWGLLRDSIPSLSPESRHNSPVPNLKSISLWVAPHPILPDLVPLATTWKYRGMPRT